MQAQETIAANLSTGDATHGGQEQDRTLKNLEALLQNQGDGKAVLEDVKNLWQGAEERRRRRCEHLNRQLILGCIGRNTNRRDSIHEAATQTFGWIFRNPDLVFKREPSLEISFPCWLETGCDVFHIAGKPGSGKSTLMKYLVQHQKTTSLLRSWSRSCGTRKAVHAAFFFWKQGTWLEHSTQGLVRGLLYEILHQVPSLIPTMFPQLWHPDSMDSEIPFQNSKITESEVSDAFERLVMSPNEFREVSICFFIDGLDEYNESTQGLSHADLVRLLFTWVKRSSGRVKLCVSSREWMEFDAFSSKQRITLQNLTRVDMQIFVRHRLTNIPRFVKMEEADRKGTLELRKQLLSRADGVFLWITLMVKSLERGITRGDSVEKLQKRVRETPQDMRYFLTELLNSVEDCYKVEVYLLLGIAMRATGSIMAPNEGRAGNPSPSSNKITVNRVGEFITMASAALFFKAIDCKRSIRTDPGKVRKSLPQQRYESEKEAAEKVRGRCYGLLEAMNGYVKFTHQSIPEMLQEQLPERARQFGITDSLVGEAMCWMLLSEAKHHGFDLRITAFENHGVVEYNRWRLRTLMSTLAIASMGSQVATFRLLESLDQQLLRSSFGVDVFTDEHWKHVRPELQTKCGNIGLDMSRNGGSDYVCNPCVPLITNLACLYGLHEFVSWKLQKGFLETADGHLARHMLFHCVEGIASGVSNAGDETLTALLDGGVSPLSTMGLGDEVSADPIFHSFLKFVLDGSYLEKQTTGMCQSRQCRLYWSILRSWAARFGTGHVLIFTEKPGCVSIESNRDRHKRVSVHAVDDWWKLLRNGKNTVHDLANMLDLYDAEGNTGSQLGSWADGEGPDWDHIRRRGYPDTVITDKVAIQNLEDEEPYLATPTKPTSPGVQPFDPELPGNLPRWPTDRQAVTGLRRGNR